MAAPIKEGVQKDNTLRNFKGVNTQSSRTTIGDDEFAWLENIIPIGFGNMRAVPAQSGVLATWFPDVCYFQQSENLNGVDYDYVFTTNGAAYQVNLSSYAVTKFAPASTFSGSGTTIAQWENTQIIIVDPVKGYFVWNGSTLTKLNGTLQSLTISALGIGYTSQPTITIAAPGGGGVTATATADIQVGLATLSAAGTGYAPGDILTIAGGTAVTPATLRVATVSGAGGITGFNINTTGDYTGAPANPASVTGGYGTGATFTLNFGIGPLTITNAGSGYASTPAVTVTLGGGSAGAITANLTVVPSVGTSVAAYGGRIWVSSGRTVIFSAPNSYSDFTSGSAGGSFIISDESLHSNITGMLSANNFLYVFGLTSINVISGVSVVGGATVFTNTNISADVGTDAPASCVVYSRSVWFSTPYGIQAVYGSTTQKTSDHLDGIFPLINGTQNITSGIAIINNLKVLCFLVNYIDPVVGARALIAMFYDKKWFFGSQGNGLTSIVSAVINDTSTLFATDGTNLYKLFSDVTAQIPQTIITKLWDMGTPLREKQSLKFGLEHIVPSAPVSITGTIDTEYANNNYPFSLLGGNAVQWINGNGNLVDWTNGTGQVVTWLNSGYSFQALDVEINGFYLGVTLNAMAASEDYQGLHLQYELRASWPG